MTRPIAIAWAANGWVVTVGCQQFVFESRVALLNRLGEYLESPEAAENNAAVWAQNMKFTLATGVGGVIAQETAQYDPQIYRDETARIYRGGPTAASASVPTTFTGFNPHPGC